MSGIFYKKAEELTVKADEDSFLCTDCGNEFKMSSQIISGYGIKEIFCPYCTKDIKIKLGEEAK